MPRYHFNVLDGVSMPDLEGTELPDLGTARREAILLASALIESDVERVELGQDWRLIVTDGDGTLLFSLVFKMTELHPSDLDQRYPTQPHQHGPEPHSNGS